MLSIKSIKWHLLWLISILFATCLSEAYLFAETAGSATFSGELKKWHKVTLTFDGPMTGETATPNPFTDYRLQVTFTQNGKSFSVPGYYAADGHSANSSATSGNKWRVHFAPNATGRWNYQVEFRTGSNIALNTTSGSTAGFMDGTSGFFDIDASDKQQPDLRFHGRLSYVNEHYLQFEDSKEYFLKQGPDAPENFLAYKDFDGNFKDDGHKDNLVKTWSAHISDWKTGDPTWKNNMGKGIIGSINYLASEGMNAFSFLTMNINGDDRNVFPYTSYTERFRMDCSKLDQWEIVLEHADKMGMYLHFKTQETENDHLLNGGALGNQRKLYYRELIARFSHHLALNWNLGEEYDLSTDYVKDYAQYFYDNDPYRHNVVIHTYPGQKNNIYTPLLGSASKLTGASLQTSNRDFTKVFPDVKTWVDKSREAGKKWVVACDEPGDAQHALVPDSVNPSHDNARKNALWGTLMAGGAGNEWYFGYKNAHSDLTCQDFRSRDLWWDQCRIALTFFKQNKIPYWQMLNDNSLSSNENDYCFYKANHTYLVYLKNGGTTSLNLNQAGASFKVKWFNPRTGGSLQNGSVTKVQGGNSVSLGQAPSETNQDWVILIQQDDNIITETEGYVVIEAENTELSNNWVTNTTATIQGTNEFTGSGYLRYLGNSEVSGPANDVIRYKIRITNPGNYKFIMRGLEAPIETGEGDKANDCYVRMVGQPGNFGVFKKHVLLGNSYQWSWNIKAEFSTHTFSQPIYNLSAGIHTFEIAGRSKNFFIDRVVLYKDITNQQAKDLSLKNSDEVTFNQAPEVDAGIDQEINLPINSIQLQGSVSDDELPEGNQLQISWTKVSGPGSVTYSNADQALTSATFSSAGEYTLELSASDGDFTSTDRVNVLVIDPTSNIATFQVQSDAYLQGTSNYNNTMLRVEMNKRTSYLKFNVSNIVGQITKATLILTEGGDVGNGTLEIYSASHNNWTETTLSASNAPVTTALITRFQGSISGAQKVSLDVTSWINQLGTYTLVLKMSEGNDVAFSSKEGNNPPQLIIESELPINQAPVISAGADIELPFPNHSTTLNGEVSDDGLPYGSTLSSWTKVEGPGDVDFSDSTSSSTTASFSEIGIYTLKLSADDGELSSEYSIQVTVLPENISVTKFVLVDADRDLDVKILQDGDSINTAIYGANLNIRAEVEGPVESVRFQLNNNIKLENVAPYAIFGDTSGDYKAWPNPIGDHAILATPFYADKAQGGAGQSNSLQLAVTTASLPYQSVVQFLLMNAVTNKEIRPLYHGARISLSHDGNDLSVVAKVGDGVESLVFDLDNQIGIQTENVPPYALSGDKSGDFYSWTPSVGSHTLTATPYSADKASGAMGVPLQIEFIVTE